MERGMCFLESFTWKWKKWSHGISINYSSGCLGQINCGKERSEEGRGGEEEEVKEEKEEKEDEEKKE